MSPLEIFGSMIAQYKYYFDIKIPELTPIKDVNKIIICGMGGSAFPAEIVIDHIREKYKREIVFLNRDYELPYWVDQNTLVIASSFSGSTEETLSCMNEALKRKIPVLGMSMGGEISRICSESKLPYISLPKVVMPRFGAGFMTAAILRVAYELKLIPQQDEEINNIDILISPLIVNIQKTTEALSKKIKERIISIYTDSYNISAGNIAKICINETGKTIGYNNIYSESNHNELASFQHTPYPHAMLLLSYPGINNRILERFSLMPQLTEDRNIIFEKINCNFENIFYRDIYFTIFFSYLSYYIAIESGYDPVATPTQDRIKTILKSIKG